MREIRMNLIRASDYPAAGGAENISRILVRELVDAGLLPANAGKNADS
jgi:hypothetical protein